MHIGVRVKFFVLIHYWWVLTLISLGAVVYLVLKGQAVSVIATVLGSILSLFYFVQKQELEELRLFREIFQECNRRYNAMNEHLAKIATRNGHELDDCEKKTLVDYFNLCGEEYLYYSRGFLFPSVWKAWRNGMNSLLESKRIRELWESEKKTDSYYGLQL